jgi:hypothetical protein
MGPETPSRAHLGPPVRAPGPPRGQAAATYAVRVSHPDDDDRPLPAPLRPVRVLLYAGAALTALVVLGALLAGGLGGANLGRAVWVAWPGVAAFVLARRLHRGRRFEFWGVVVVCAFWTLGALATLGGGQLRGLTQLLIPVAVLALLLRRQGRDSFA